MSVIGSEIDYQPKTFNHGTYTMLKIIPVGGPTSEITLAGGNEVTFEIIPNVFNFAQSKLTFTTVPSAIPAAGAYYQQHVDRLCLIRHMQVSTRTGSLLMDVNEFATFTNMILRRETKLEDYLTWGRTGAAPVAVTSDSFEGLTPINTVGAAFDRPIGASNQITTPYSEACYMCTAAQNAVGPVIDYKIDLDRLKNTILSLNKDLWFKNDTIQLRIIWHPTNKFIWTTSTAAGGNPSTDSTDIPAANTVKVSNIALYLAIEQDTDIINRLKDKSNTEEGYHIKVPYVIMDKRSVGQSTVHAISSRFSKAQGESLLKIFYAPYNPQDTLHRAYDHDNTITGQSAATKINNYYTMVNGVKTSQLPFYDCSQRDDYLCERKKNRGCCIQSANEYYYNWVHVEDFTDNYSQYEKPLVPDQSTYIDGKDLTDGVTWDFYANTQNLQLNHYVAAVLQRNLIINSAGVYFGS